jgi:hypothetical protein
MGSVYRTNNPLEYDEVDGIVIDEVAPPANVQGVGTGLAILVGQFQRGSAELTRIAGIQDFHEKYGQSNAYLGNIQLKNKKFSALNIVRVIAEDAQRAWKAITVLANELVVITDTLTGEQETFASVEEVVGSKLVYTEVSDEVGKTDFLAKYMGAYGNSITVKIGTASAVALESGSDGVIKETDYELAIAKCEAEGAGNILFLDEYTQTRNSYLKLHAGKTQDKMVICAELENDTTADNISDVALLRDTDGRIIYAVNWVATIIGGVEKFTSPASWYASILSQSSPHIDPADVDNGQFLFGAMKLKKALTREDYKQLMKAGVSAFENDSDMGIKVKSGVVTQILNSSKLTVSRRRMTDFYTNSIGKFLKNYQNKVNSRANRVACKSAIETFDSSLERLGILPTNAEVSGGKAKLIDIETLNTNDSIAQGKFFILIKRRLYSSMRFIVLKAEIGESVLVTEGE